MHHFVTWAGLGHKSKGQKKSASRYGTSPSQPKGEWEKKKDVDATNSLACCHFDLGSGDVSRLNSTSRSNIEDTCDGAITGRPSSIHSVGSDYDLASPNARADLPNPSPNALAEQSPGSLSQLGRSKSVFATLSKKFRSRVRAPLLQSHAPNKLVPARTQDDLCPMTFRPQAVPVVLSNDPISKERREAALRARGLLPPRRPRDLSAIEADTDRRIDALRKIDSPFSGPDNGHSDANEIAQSWRIRNSIWLSRTPPNSDSPGNPLAEDASPFDTSGHSEKSSEPPTVGADPSASIIGPSSILKSLSLGSPTCSLKAASSRGSIGHQDSRPSRAASLSSTGPDGLMLPSPDLEDMATETPTGGISEDMTADFAQSAPGLSTPSKTSCAAGSQVTETPEESAPSQRSVSPSLQLEDLQPMRSLDQLPSEPQPSEPHIVAVQAQLTIPASSPLYLLSTVSDSFLASPTTPTLSQSVCYSLSETEDSSAATDNGELIDLSVSPAVKNGEVGLCQETIMEGSEPLSDDDDIDPFHSPPSPSLLTVIPRPTGDGHATAPRRRTHSLLTRLRGSTLGPTSSSALSKSASMVGLRRKMSGSLFGRTRPLSTVSHLDATPRSPPPSPLIVKIYDRTTLSAEASGIVDDEARRLSELAFLT